MKASSPAVNKYIASIIRQRDTAVRQTLFGLKEDELPFNTRKLIFEAFQLPTGRDTEMLEFEGIIDMAPIWADYIYNDKLLMVEPGIEKTGTELRKIFLPHHEEICLKVFTQEMGYIYALYYFLNPRPLKADLQSSAKRTLKILSKHLAGIEDCLARVHRKPEWPYIRELIWEAYGEEKVVKGLEKNISFSAYQFFDVVRWMNAALKRTQSNKDELFNDYTAHGRMQEQRDNSLLALAGSYHRCFNEFPTATDADNKPNFFTVARLFINFILRQEDGELDEDTKLDLIETAVAKYSQGSFRKKEA